MPSQRDLLIIAGIVAGVIVYQMVVKQFVDQVI